MSSQSRNPFCSPRFRVSGSVMRQSAAFAFGVPHDINGFHPYTVRSTDLSHPLASPYLLRTCRWAARFYRKTCEAPYTPFTPNKSG